MTKQISKSSSVTMNVSAETSGSISLLRKTTSNNNNNKTAHKTPSSAPRVTDNTSCIANEKAAPHKKQESQTSTRKIDQGQAATNTSITATKKPQKLRRRVATVAQRRAANIRERRRMFNLNSAFDRLRKKVPSFAYEKRLSRIETLKLAIMYIRFMDDLVRDEAYVEKYKRLTSELSTSGNNINQSISANAFMSPYLSSLYGGQCDSSPPTLTPPPDPQTNSNNRKSATKVAYKSELLADSETRSLASATVARPQLCTNNNCSLATSGLDSCHKATQQLYSSIATTPTTIGPSISGSGNGSGSAMICCSSPALSSSTSCNSTSSSSLNSFNESPDPSPHLKLQLQQQQQPPIVCRAPMDYYQQQQQHQEYSNYPLDQTTTSCQFVYGATEQTHQATTNQSSGHDSTKIFYSYDTTTTAPRVGSARDHHSDHRQGHQQHQTDAMMIGGDSQLADYCSLGAACIGSLQHSSNTTVSNRAQGNQIPTIVSSSEHHHHHNSLGYTLHSLQAR